MGTRGRKSAAEIAVIGRNGVAATHRPEPLPELTDEQCEVWRWIVAGYAADRFDRGAQPLLANFCRHVVASRRIAQLIEQAESAETFDVEAWNDLLKAQERQSARMEGLATKLRITPQARYTPQRAATVDGKATAARKPWE